MFVNIEITFSNIKIHAILRVCKGVLLRTPRDTKNSVEYAPHAIFYSSNWNLRLFFLKFVVAKSKNEMPNSKYGIAGIVFLSIKFTIDTIKKHIEASKKHIHLILSFSTSVKFRFFINRCSYSVISVLSSAFNLFLSAYIRKSASWHTSSKENSLLCTV